MTSRLPVQSGRSPRGDIALRLFMGYGPRRMRLGRVLQTHTKVLSIVAVAAMSLVCGAGKAAAGSSPGFPPDPGLSTVSAKPLPLISIGTGKDPNLLVDPAG